MGVMMEALADSYSSDKEEGGTEATTTTTRERERERERLLLERQGGD